MLPPIITRLLVSTALPLFFNLLTCIPPVWIGLARADTIVLKNGTRIPRVVAWEEGELIKCDRDGAVIGYPRSIVESVLKSDEPQPPEDVAGPAGPESQPTVSGRHTYQQGSLVVKKIFDGDTFDATDGNLYIRFRIAGIDAPEKGNPAKGRPAQPFAEEASRYMAGALLNRTVRVRGLGLDVYNRQLAEVFLDEENIGLSLVRKGLAEVYRGKTDLDLRPYIAAEEMARRGRQGIWSQGSEYVSPRTWRSRNPR